MRQIGENARPAESTPLSLSQQQMWFMDRLDPQSSLYNIPLAYRLRGALDPEALRSAVQDIHHRHEALRTRFPETDGVPGQQVQPVDHGLLSVVDLEGTATGERETAIRERYVAEALAPFDLERGPLSRTVLLRLADDDHVLILVFHHIVFDAVSLGVFLGELTLNYRAALRGERARLTPLPLQFSDYALWETTRSREEGLRYWKDKFSSVPPRLQLPTDRNRPAVRTQNGAVVRFPVDPALVGRMAKLSQDQGVTQFVSLLAVFQVLLARYTGQSDIVVGVPFAGRVRDDLELDALIGCFINTLPIRVDLAGDPTFRQVLERVSDEMLDAFDHQEVQFDEIVRLAQPDRDASYNPLVQVTFGLLDSADDGLDLPRVAVERLADVRTTAKFDLSLDLLQIGDGLTGEVEYNVDLFDEATIHRITGHWLQLLGAAIETPDLPVSQLRLLTDEEWDRSVVSWNRSEVEVPGPALMHQLFADQARRSPSAIAVVHGARKLSYAELDRRANQLAHLLRASGIGPESSVGVCMERSIETVVALLGILKSGGVYVPLDPDYPSDRLAYMVADSRVEFLLTDTVTMNSLPDTGVPRILLDQDREALEAQPAGPPPELATPDNLACLFYTSGSSGLPKCGMLSHANYVNYFRFWEREYLRVTPMRVHLQMTSFAFDIFIADTTRALFSGATLVMVPRSVVMSPPDLYALMVREQVNSAEFITPILAALVDHLEETGQSLEFMDLICAGSDIWYARDFLRTKQLCKPSVRLIAAYGTSETSNDNSTFEQGPDDPDFEGIVPIGRPVANTRLYVLDQGMQPVPVGFPGELHIGGISLGRGYHRRPALTAERFVPDPLGGDAGSRLYRTGDLARYRPDGVLEILGRVDNQVKVRGFRVELGEIESVMRESPGVEDAVVVVRRLGSDENQLIGYVTFQPEGRRDSFPERTGPGAGGTAAVRTHLETRLPAYMVPSVLVELAEIPLSANGKLDRRALPDPSAEQLAGQSGYLAPRTPTEELLCGVWSDVLGQSRVGVNDNFFSLGGSSLLLTRVISRVRAIWSVELPVHAFYRFPTVAALAVEVTTLGQSGRSGRTGVSVIPRSSRILFETSFAQQQLWFHDQLEPEAATYNVPTVLRLRGPLDPDVFGSALQAVVDRHEVLRTVFVVEATRLWQRVRPGSTVTPTWIDLTGLDPARQWEEAMVRIRDDEQAPFDLYHGPLLRATVLRLAPDQHILMLTLHHVVTDGWSTGVIFDELAAEYTGGSTGAIAPRSESVHQYIDFAAWQRAWLNGETAARQLEQWRRRLAGAPVAIRLPFDRPRSEVRGYAGAQVPFAISPEVHAALRKFSNASGSTLFMTLLAGFQALLSRCGQDTDIVVGTSAAGRTQVETERMLGFFVNMLPLRTDLSGDPSFRELVERVRETALEAYANQDVPFEKIVETVRPPRNAYQNPVFQVALVLDDGPEPGLRLPGIEAVEVEVEHSTSKFDLSLQLTAGASGLTGAFSYKTDLFDRSTVEQLAADLTAVLESVVADPGLRLNALPVTTSPRPDPAGPEVSEPETGPTAEPGPLTPVQEVLSAIWCQVLDLEQVGMNENFFLIGGTSLLITRVGLAVQELLGHKIPVRVLFESSTIAALAIHVEQVLDDEARERLAVVFSELNILEPDATADL
jgi:amino acid adenylation domain-containing protein